MNHEGPHNPQLATWQEKLDRKIVSTIVSYFMTMESVPPRQAIAALAPSVNEHLDRFFDQKVERGLTPVSQSLFDALSQAFDDLRASGLITAVESFTLEGRGLPGERRMMGDFDLVYIGYSVEQTPWTLYWLRQRHVTKPV